MTQLTVHHSLLYHACHMSLALQVVQKIFHMMTSANLTDTTGDFLFAGTYELPSSLFGQYCHSKISDGPIIKMFSRQFKHFKFKKVSVQ